MFETFISLDTEEKRQEYFFENYDKIAEEGVMHEEYYPYIQGIYYLNGIQRSAFLDGKIEDAKKMLSKGYSLSDISEITDLPIETIREIKPDN
jgi:hypothetical protein